MTIAAGQPVVTWEPLVADFQLDDEPVVNLSQPLLAAALTEALELAGRLEPTMLLGTNLGVCATVDGQLVIKAPDWFYVRALLPNIPPNPNRRSYTPNLEGDVPAIVMEFLSETEGGEYSIKSKHPPGKWYFYERILKVPTYAIFDPQAGWIEVYQLDALGRYQLQQADANDRYWIEAIGLFLGVWYGRKVEQTTHWLRWWDQSGQLLPWGVELLEQKQQQIERMAAQLRELGANPDEI
jgi:Uma2 family endonuclease